MTYSFLTKVFNDDVVYYAVPSERIERLNLYNTYDGYGGEIGHTTAGDYHFANSECDAINDCVGCIAKEFGIDRDDINIVDEGSNIFCIEAGDGAEYGFDEKAVNAFIRKWRAENEVLTEVDGFTFWDGSNFQTVITSSQLDGVTHNVVDDDNLIESLNDAIDNGRFEATGIGVDVYVHGDWVVIVSHWQGSFAEYEIMSIGDYVVRQRDSGSLPAIELNNA